MNRVVSYDYPIDNKEEMIMEMGILRIDDVHFDQAEVSVTMGTALGNVVSLDFDPDDYGERQTLMQYSPDAARKLASALILAAEEAEKQ